MVDWMDGQMDRQTDGWMDGCVDGWMVDEWISSFKTIPRCPQSTQSLSQGSQQDH